MNECEARYGRRSEMKRDAGVLAFSNFFQLSYQENDFMSESMHGIILILLGYL